MERISQILVEISDYMMYTILQLERHTKIQEELQWLKQRAVVV